MPSINTFRAQTLNLEQDGHWRNSNKSTEIDKSIIACYGRKTIKKNKIWKDIKMTGTLILYLVVRKDFSEEVMFGQKH